MSNPPTSFTHTPYRSVELAAEPSAPKGLIVRVSDEELVIERRSRRLVSTLALVGGGGLLIGAFVPPLWVPAPLVGLFTGGVVGFVQTRWCARTTLVLRAGRFNLTRDFVFRRDQLEGPLDELMLVGPQSAPSKVFAESWISLSAAGRQVKAFRGEPIQNLLWILNRVREWRDAPRGAGALPPAPSE